MKRNCEWSATLMGVARFTLRPKFGVIVQSRSRFIRGCKYSHPHRGPYNISISWAATRTSSSKDQERRVLRININVFFTKVTLWHIAHLLRLLDNPYHVVADYYCCAKSRNVCELSPRKCSTLSTRAFLGIWGIVGDPVCGLSQIPGFCPDIGVARLARITDPSLNAIGSMLNTVPCCLLIQLYAAVRFRTSSSQCC